MLKTDNIYSEGISMHKIQQIIRNMDNLASSADAEIMVGFIFIATIGSADESDREAERADEYAGVSSLWLVLIRMTMQSYLSR